jgi:hypothetical protein
MANLNDRAFTTMLALRTGYPLIPGATQCPECNSTDACGPSLVHALSCRRTKSQATRTERHSGIQSLMKQSLESKELNPSVTTVPGVPSYENYGFIRRGDKSAGKISKADQAILMGEATHLIDYNVTAIIKDGVKAGVKSLRAFARLSEERKISELKTHYNVTDAQLAHFHPFVIECSGTFGERANSFLGMVVFRRMTCPAHELDEKGSAASYQARHILRTKERLAAKIHAFNDTLVRFYLKLRNVSFPPKAKNSSYVAPDE